MMEPIVIVNTLQRVYILVVCLGIFTEALSRCFLTVMEQRLLQLCTYEAMN